MRPHHAVIAEIDDQRTGQLPLDGEVKVQLLRQARHLAILPPRHVLSVLEGRRDERRHRVRRQAVLEQERWRQSVGAVREAGGLGETFLMRRSGGGGHLRERSGETGADHSFVAKVVCEADAWSEAPEPGIGEGAAALPAGPRPCIDQSAEAIIGARIRGGKREIAPAVLFLVGRQSGFPAEAKVYRQTLRYAPIVLDISGPIWPVLADVAHSVNLPVGGPAEQE